MTSPHIHSPAAEKVFDFQFMRRVEFCDTDMAGIMHFSNYFRFMESAETAFLRSLGLSVWLSRHNLELCLPRVHAECDYRAPLHFEDEVLIHLLVERKGKSSLTYQFRFYRGANDERLQVARGRVVLVCAAPGADGRLKAVPLPKALADRIQQAPAPLLAEHSRSPGAVRTASKRISGNGPSQEGNSAKATGRRPTRTEGRRAPRSSYSL
jgi:acyl-CoA thioester hydrolase